MKGIALDALTENLYHVQAGNTKEPAREVSDILQRLDFSSCLQYLDPTDFTEENILRMLSKLSIEAFAHFSFDEICKFQYGSPTMLDESVMDLFKKEMQYEVVRKIQYSIFRWGHGPESWNDIVDFYNHLRTFSLSLGDDFELRIDHATHHNEKGYAKYTRTFLDGAFAYLVHYKGKHVMTIGFSVQAGRKILLQQVQLAHRKGNRFLYKFPHNRIEFILEKFRSHFSEYDIYLIEVDSLIQKILGEYEKGFERIANVYLESVAEHASASSEEWQKTKEALDFSCNAISEASQKLAHVRQDRERLISFYENTGKFVRGALHDVSGYQFYQIT